MEQVQISLNLLRGIQSVTIAQNVTIDNAFLQALAYCDNLQVLTLDAVSFDNNTKSNVLSAIGSCKELVTISLNGAVGFPINTDLPDTCIPASWNKLTRLKTVNLANTGLSTLQVNKLVVDLCAMAKLGMSRANLTGNVLLLNGVNAKPDLTVQAVTDAKAWLLANGWTVTHN